jgi:hypothetical protein
MVSQGRKRPGEKSVEVFHNIQEPRVPGNPRLGGAGRDCYSDAEPFLKVKPRLKSTPQGCAAVIENCEFMAGQTRRHRSAVPASQRLVRAVAQ